MQFALGKVNDDLRRKLILKRNDKDYIMLNNQMEMPFIGLGANGIPFGNDEERIKQYRDEYEFYLYALQTNMCHMFDTSAAYGRNDEALGQAIDDLNMRKEVIVMSKVSNAQQRDGDIRRAFEAHLKYLKTDYIDIYSFHWPQTGTFIKTYLELEKLYNEGLIKAIGVCNCNIHHLEEIMSCANVLPVVNQFELHPLFTQDALVNYCKAFDIQPLAYTPLARMHDVLMCSKPIRNLAQKYKKTPAQIVLRWHIDRNESIMLRTRNKRHFEEMFKDVYDFELEEKEICWINSLNDNVRLRYNPDLGDFTYLG